MDSVIFPKGVVSYITNFGGLFIRLRLLPFSDMFSCLAKIDELGNLTGDCAVTGR